MKSFHFDPNFLLILMTLFGREPSKTELDILRDLEQKQNQNHAN